MAKKTRDRIGAVKEPTESDLRGRSKHRIKVGEPAVVNRVFPLTPDARRFYYQNGTLQCVSGSWSQCLTIVNGGKLYAVAWHFFRCQERDHIPGEDGTTTDAGGRVLMELGHVVMADNGSHYPYEDSPGAQPDIAEGIEGFGWVSRTPGPCLAEMRGAIASGTPLVFVLPWFSNFGLNDYAGESWLIPQNGNWGNKGGQHQICINGARDDREAFSLPNTYGYPHDTLMPYSMIEPLVNMGCYAATFTDRDGTPAPPTPPPGPTTFNCRFCGKPFTDKARRRKHVRKKHR